jgi:hypothetical protein
MSHQEAHDEHPHVSLMDGEKTGAILRLTMRRGWESLATSLAFSLLSMTPMTIKEDAIVEKLDPRREHSQTNHHEAIVTAKPRMTDEKPGIFRSAKGKS